jgi:hypothetical protein
MYMDTAQASAVRDGKISSHNIESAMVVIMVVLFIKECKQKKGNESKQEVLGGWVGGWV